MQRTISPRRASQLRRSRLTQDEPRRSDDLDPCNPKSHALEEPERVSDYDGTDVALEVNFKDGILSDLESARNWAEVTFAECRFL